MLASSKPFLTRAMIDCDVPAFGAHMDVKNMLSQANLSMLDDVMVDFINDIHPEWRIQLSNLDDCAYDMDVESKILILNTHGLTPKNALQSKFFTPQIILALIEGLRMVRHVELLDGALERYNPKTIIHIGRICMADGVTHAINAAWDAKNAGYDAPWKHLLCGDYGALAHKFATVMETFLSGGMDDDMAMRQCMAITFNDWFVMDDKLFQCDHDSLNMMDDMLDDDIIFAGKPLETITIACLTNLAGDHVTYLQKPHVDDVLNNPYYTDVTNPINRTHLTHLTNDLQSTHVNGIQFRDTGLAARFIEVD